MDIFNLKKKLKCVFLMDIFKFVFVLYVEINMRVMYWVIAVVYDICRKHVYIHH